MMVWKRVLQTLRGGTGTRLVLVSIYAVLTYRFYMSGQDRGIFIGMFRMPDAASGSSLMSNLYAICFMVFGAAAGATVEVSEHSRDNGVCAPSSRMVEVRELLHGSVCVLSGICRAAIGSGLGHSERTQCIAYGWCGVCGMDGDGVAVDRQSWLSRREPCILAAMVSYLVPLSYVPLMRWLVGASVSFGQPRWIAVLLVMTIALVVANYALFKRLEII